METYKLEISVQELLGMLSNYFTLKHEKPIQVKEKHCIYTDDRGDKNLKVEIYYEEQIEILGHTATKTTTLSKEEVREILTELMDNNNYSIESLNYDADIQLKGYYEYEEAVFKGVTLQLKEQQKKLRK